MSTPTDLHRDEFPSSDADLSRLHQRLTQQAQSAGLVDVGYREVDSPIGPLLLAATDRGLARVAFASEDFEAVLDTLARRLSPRIVRAPRRLDDATRELHEYFAGDRRSFDLPLDFTLSSGFRQQVQRHLSQIGYGQTASYGQVAAAVGSPQAVRAVGSACATNPLPVVVPCHRVVRSDGSLGGYLGGLATKASLLEWERSPGHTPLDAGR